MKLVTVPEMLAIEKEADANGLSYAEMMENAGVGLADVILELFFDDGEGLSVVGLVGSGNNGGDTLVALEHLVKNGWNARAYLIKRKTDELVRRLESAGGEIVYADQDKNYDTLAEFIETSDLLLDGILGTGIKLPLKEEVARLLLEVNDVLDILDEPPFVIAVDCPSGVDCDTGAAADECIPADVTVTMAAVKQGLLKLPAFELVGDLVTVDIGLPDDLPALQTITTEVAEENLVADLLPERPLQAHKGTFGTALVVAGSVNYTGAALLSGKAAYRIGAGLVSMGVPNPVYGVLAGHFPEATWLLLPHQTGVIARDAVDVLWGSMSRATALLLGPGFGTEDATRDFLVDLLKGKAVPKKAIGRIGFVQEKTDSDESSAGASLPPLVIDADGLRLLAEIENWPGLLPTPAVLTPHPGEMSALTGLSVSEIQADRLGVAKNFAQKWGQVVVLKGAFTVVAAPDGRTTTIPVASPALARAGTGDVLAGLIVGLRAQGVDAYEAALAGAWIHAQAGLLAAEAYGGTASVLAGDVLEAIPDVLAELLEAEQ
ncbi:MAG: bifunctional ADP-dependent NAD(P)H-hydrate dehydratase/NAD(P)H-hydrate epimerase [Anaerolineales bacterium]